MSTDNSSPSMTLKRTMVLKRLLAAISIPGLTPAFAQQTPQPIPPYPFHSKQDFTHPPSPRDRFKKHVWLTHIRWRAQTVYIIPFQSGPIQSNPQNKATNSGHGYVHPPRRNRQQSKNKQGRVTREVVVAGEALQRRILSPQAPTMSKDTTNQITRTNHVSRR